MSVPTFAKSAIEPYEMDQITSAFSAVTLSNKESVNSDNLFIIESGSLLTEDGTELKKVSNFACSTIVRP